jgi:F-type H+-transporting ATPase subunit epsilon
MPFLSILTPKGVALEREVDEITAPGVVGEFGVLHGHIPLITATRAGVLSYRRGGEQGKVAVGPGFVEVLGQEVSVLVQRAVPGSEVDPQAAEQERMAAEARLKRAGADEAEKALAQAEIDWAEAQLAAR